jgi:hypothetical protein
VLNFFVLLRAILRLPIRPIFNQMTTAYFADDET